MRVRPALESDVPALAQLRVELLEATGSRLDAAERAALLASNEAFFRDHIASPLWQHWVAEIGGAVVAIGTLAFFMRPPYPGNPEGRDAYFLNMYTQPLYRGRGAASAIIQAALACAQERGVRKLILHATEAGRPIYAKLGFVASSAYMEWAIAPADAAAGVGASGAVADSVVSGLT